MRLGDGLPIIFVWRVFERMKEKNLYQEKKIMEENV